MPEIRRKFDPEFCEGVVRIVRETKKPIAVIARDLGSTPARSGTGSTKTALSEATATGSGSRTRRSSSSSVRRTLSPGWNRMPSKRSVVLWVKEATT